MACTFSTVIVTLLIFKLNFKHLIADCDMLGKCDDCSAEASPVLTFRTCYQRTLKSLGCKYIDIPFLQQARMNDLLMRAATYSCNLYRSAAYPWWQTSSVFESEENIEPWRIMLFCRVLDCIRRMASEGGMRNGLHEKMR